MALCKRIPSLLASMLGLVGLVACTGAITEVGWSRGWMTHLLPLTITGLTTWIVAPLIVWLISLIAGLLLPLILFKKLLEKKQDAS